MEMEYAYIISGFYSIGVDGSHWVECVVLNKNRANEILKELQADNDINERIYYSMATIKIRE